MAKRSRTIPFVNQDPILALRGLIDREEAELRRIVQLRPAEMSGILMKLIGEPEKTFRAIASTGDDEVRFVATLAAMGLARVIFEGIDQETRT